MTYLKKYLLTALPVLFVVTGSLFAQNPGLVNPQINPNPYIVAGTGTAEVTLQSTTIAIPNSIGMEINISFGNTLPTGPPTGAGASYFTWSQPDGANTYNGVQISTIPGQGSSIPIPFTALITFPITVTGTGGALAGFNVQLVNTAGLNGNDSSDDQSAFFTPIAVPDLSFNESLPMDTTIDCSALIPTPDVLTVTDTCTSMPVITNASFIETTTAGICPQERTITRTWSSMDACGNGNMIEHIQIINIIDTIAPVLDIPDNITQACNEESLIDIAIDFQGLETSISGNFVDAGNPVVQDGYQFLQTSDGTTPISSFQVTPTNSSSYPGTTTLISPLANQIVVVTPLSGVPFTIASIDLALIVGPSTTVAFTGTTSAGATTVMQTFTVLPGALQTFNFNATFTDLVSLSYTGTGPSPAFRFHVDNLMLTTTGFGLASAMDLCDPSPTIASMDNSTQTSDGSCTDYSYTIERIWMATDACMNVAVDTQTITIQDLNDPTITFCPSDTTITCDVPQDSMSLGTAMATDSCDINPSVSFVDVSTQTTDGSCTDYSYIITRTWTAMDACSNESMPCVQTITVVDTIAPMITLCAADTTINCGTAIDTMSLGVPIVTDNCDVNPSLSFVDVSTQTSDGSCTDYMYTITRTWTVMDACSNVSLVTCDQIISVVDTIAPMITLCAADTTINCGTAMDTMSLGVPVVTDNCDVNPSLSFVDVSTQTSDGSCTDYSYMITRTWTAMDVCSNVSLVTCDQIITVVDTVAPTSVFCPSNVTITCTTPVDTMTLGSPVITDNCDINPTFSFADVTTQTSDGICTDYNYTITRTWTATDICMNTSTCVQTIMVSDLIAPVPVCPPAISRILNPNTCSTIIDFLVTSSDNCDINPVVEQVDATGLSSGDFFEIGVTTLSYRAIDACGNTSPPCDVRIEILDYPFPISSLSCNQALNVSLDANCQAEINASALLVGGPYSCYLSYDVAIEGAGSGSTVTINGTGDYTVTITDPSGELSCWGTIHAEDYVAPVITCNDYTLNCSANTDPVPLPVVAGVAGAYEPVVFEPCGNVSLIHRDEIIDGTCSDTFQTQILRTWIATDATGLTAQCVQTISLRKPDITAVTFPESLDDLNNPALSCSGSYPRDDNGFPDPSLTGRPMLDGLQLQSGDVCGLGIGYVDQEIMICDGTTKILRTWQVVDWCNTSFIASQVQTIKIKDDQGPNVTCPVARTVSTDFDLCSTSLILPGLIALTDNCASVSTLSYTPELVSSEGVLTNTASNGYVLQDLPIGAHTVTYTALDDCGNSSTCNWVLTVEDQVSPTMVCETSHTVTIQNLGTNEVSLVAADVFDDGSTDVCGIANIGVRRMTGCISFDWTTLGGGIDSDPNSIVNWRDQGIDNPNPNIDEFYPEVPFACCDVGTVVMVEYRVTDTNGNFNTCMVEVIIDDKDDPIITCPANQALACGDELPPITDDLMENPGDGLAEVYQVINVVNGFTTYTDDEVVFLGYYPVIENCGAKIYVRETGSLNNCGIGNINRLYQAEDLSNNMSSTCVQTIAFTNNDPFTIVDTNPSCTPFTTGDNAAYPAGPHSQYDDVEWPCDVTVSCNSSSDNTDPTISGQPILNESSCDIVTLDYYDSDLTVQGSACRHISRKWVVSDLCQFQEINGTPVAGYWEYIQYIIVNDTNKPVFDNCDNLDVVAADVSSCTGIVGLTQSGTDPCTAVEDLRWEYTIDPDNDGVGPFITGTTNDASGNYPIGTHSISWKLEDGCGNKETCTQLFYVVDEATPNLVLISEPSVSLVPQVPSGGSAELWASELNLSSFDQCNGPVDLVIERPPFVVANSPDSPPASATAGVAFDCDDLPFVDVRVWGRDQVGNWTFIIATVNVMDNNNACGPVAPLALVSGGSEGIINENNEKISNVMVEVMSEEGNMLTSTMTGNDGLFSFELPTNNTYSIHTERNDWPLNGISTYDLILMSQHILGIQPLDSPYKLIAADINQSGTITAFDMLELRKLLLFVNTAFPANTSWRFMDANFVFDDPTDPFANTFPEVILINDLTSNMDANFMGIKTGDVNLSATPNGLQSADTRDVVGEWTLAIDEEDMIAGEAYTIEFTNKNINQLLGYQFTLEFDSDQLEFVEVKQGDLGQLNEDNFGLSLIDQGIITSSWHHRAAVKLNPETVLFSLTFKAKTSVQLSKAIQLNSAYTKAEAYNENGELLDLILDFGKENQSTESPVFALFQNQPNPFKEETTIGFSLPNTKWATLSVYDIAGRLLLEKADNFSAGYHEVVLQKADLGQGGILYYTLKTAENHETKKMILH